MHAPQAAEGRIPTVATHSLLCAFAPEIIGEPRLQLTALLHDAQEAYVGDIPAPLKEIIGGHYKRIENKLQKEIMQKFGGIYPVPPIIHLIDKRMALTERDYACNHKTPWKIEAEGVRPYDSKELLRAFNRVAIALTNGFIPWDGLSGVHPRVASSLFIDILRFFQVEVSNLPNSGFNWYNEKFVPFTPCYVNNVDFTESDNDADLEAVFECPSCGEYNAFGFFNESDVFHQATCTHVNDVVGVYKVGKRWCNHCLAPTLLLKR
jgi:hypothetical protein